MTKKNIMITTLVAAAIVGVGASINTVLPIWASQSYEQKMAAYNKAMDQYKKDLEAYNIKIKECEDLNTAFQNRLTAYNAAKAKYDADLKKYEEAMKRLQESSNKEGYISVPTAQSLIFKSEPDANLSIVANGVATTNRNVELAKGQTAVATYTNLKNTTYAGQKIAKVVYTYTAKDDAGDTVIIEKDPTKTVTIKNRAESAKGVSSTVGMKIEFYKEDGSKVAFTEEYPAVIAFNSLNRTKVYIGSGLGESIKNLSSNIRYVPITGSAVQYKNGVISSSVYNDYKANGSRFNANNASTNPMHGDANYWDGDSQPNRWYGAAAGIVKSGDSISFDIHNGSASDASHPAQGNFWFAFNSNVASVELPEKPVAPTKPEEPNCVPPQKPTPPVKPDEPVCNIRVRYIDESGNDLTPPSNVFGSDQKCGTDYTTDKKTFDGYEFKEMRKDSNDPNGKLQEGGNKDVIYVYTKIKMCNIRVRYIDTNGKELFPTNNVFDQEQRCGTDYNTEKKDFTGYVFKEMHKDSNNPNGKLQEGGNKDVIYVYAPLCNIKVRYIDNNGNELFPTKNVFDEPKECGENYDTEKKEFPGYRFEKMHDDSCDASGKLEDGSDCEVIYVYIPICNIRVKHVDVNGNELIPSKNVFEEDQDCGTPYETKKEEIPGYTFKEMHSDSCDPNGTLEKDSDCEVIYVYVPVCNIKVKHIDVYGNTLIDSKNVYDEDKECGDPYETKREDIPGYRFVRIHPDSCEPNGKLGEKDCEVIYVYEKIEAPDTGFRADQMPLYVLIGGSILTIIGYGVFRKR